MYKFESIKLDKNHPQHLYVQLYKMIKELILLGHLKEADRLPPVRAMSKMLEINNVTVVKAYEILEKEGLVYKKIGSGTYISKQLINQLNEVDQESKQQTNIRSQLMEQGHIKVEKNMINFASATPSADLFPVEDFKQVLNEVLDRDKGYAFDYQEGQGYYQLRKILKDYIFHYGIKSEVENIQIISGAQQGIDIISKALVNYGDYVLIESPSYTGAMAAFNSRGAKMIDIPLQKDGLDLDILEKKIKTHKPRFIYVMPNFQNPTGISYSPGKKKELLKICKNYNMYIVEDDYLSDLNFYSEDNTTLKKLDEDELVIYIKSFSKIFMPGLRLGFLVIPSKLHENLLMAKHTTDISTSGLLQRAFELYLDKGIWQQHLKYMEDKYKERFVVMKESIKEYFPEYISYSLPLGGVNFWFKLPKGFSSKELYERSVVKNIIFAPGNLFFMNNNDEGYFRLSIAAVNPSEIKYGIKILSIVIREYIDKRRDQRNDSLIKPIL
ncbi:MocR-like pyridoxine biosynthesis transcription factor PdxR [Alkaliphilus peptidifermentans]|uniref:Transcriptional regulator, GntR family n=1 Tax=Alkaliphilus peptidifermentans DSM 18978 TaxID=1120976 RepID=A0A1G5CQ51_9FIRM|nr:PLP-dependent aminotransferase family protein [Alkaliphilus peptidifermentans]SCY04573.1 transcriptional regulator, GntR family [Alkaliphilus peptidifermentans DSM 18978]